MVLGWVLTGVGAFAFGHALIHRSDAFTAAGTLTKPQWVAITAGGTAVITLFGAISVLGIIGVVAVLVYLADVRPTVTGDPPRPPQLTRWLSHRTTTRIEVTNVSQLGELLLDVAEEAAVAAERARAVGATGSAAQLGGARSGHARPPPRHPISG